MLLSDQKRAMTVIPTCAASPRRRERLLCGLLTAAALGAGCASAPPAVEEPSPVEPAAGPLPGTNYLSYAADRTGLRVRDTRTGSDSVVVPAFDRLALAAPSPDGLRLAVAFRRGDTSAVVLVDAVTGLVTPIHQGLGDGTHTLGWSGDGRRLGVGYQPGARDPSRGVILVVGADGSTDNAGCSVSDRFEAWRDDGTMIVSDGRNVYTVRATGCATVATLPMSGKRDFSFSRDGTRLTFNRVSGIDAGLTVSASNGANARRIADPQFLPRNVRWSPDNRKLAFEIRSRQYANVTHIAVYDVASNRVTIGDQQTPLGLPIDANPCWSPSGRRLAYDRQYPRSSGEQAYTMHQKVVKTVSDGVERVVSEELVSDRSGATLTGVDVCHWADEDHLLVPTSRGWDVVNVQSGTSYAIPGERRVVLVRVFP